MKTKKNILVLVEHFGQGGAEKAAMLIAQMLAESKKYKVFLYAVHKPPVLPSQKQLAVGSLGINPSKDIFGKLLNYYIRLNRLRSLKRELGVDLTISSLWPVDWINALAGKDKKIAIIQINILNNTQNKTMVRFKSLVSKVYNRFDKVVLGSSNLEHELTHFFNIRNERLTTVHNPIDSKQIDENINALLPHRLEVVLDKYDVLVAANRLHPIKNTRALIPVYQSLSRKEDIKLLIIGEGEEKDLLIQTIEAAGLRYSQLESEAFDESASVYLLNFQANIHNIISRSKLFLFPTKGEGLPLALIESLYCGVPVLVSDCPNGGVFEVLQGKGTYDPKSVREEPEKVRGGYLMPVPISEKPASINLWKEKIEEILVAQPDVLADMQEQNRARALDFDKELIKYKWLQLIEEVMAK